MGGLNLAHPLVGILQTARRYPDFLRRLARTATDWRPPLDFLVGFRCAVGKVARADRTSSWAESYRSRAWRAFNALSEWDQRSLQPSTAWWPPRRSAVSSGKTAEALREAFTIVCDIRLERHAACIKAGETPDNLIDPEELRPLERASLREVFLGSRGSEAARALSFRSDCR